MSRRILVVDDEKSFTHFVRRGLELVGDYKVREENHSPSSLAAARQFKPDLILLDLMMPEMNGMEVAKQLLEDAEMRGTPVLFLTGAPLTNGVPEGFAGQVHRYTFLPKPVQLEHLVAWVQKQTDPPSDG